MADALTLPYVWTLDTLSFGDGSEPRYLRGMRGWQGRTEPRTNKAPKVGDRGDWVGGSYDGPRTIEGELIWWPTGAEERFAAIDAITELCSSGGPTADYVLRRTEGTRDRWTRCRLDDELIPEVGPSGLLTAGLQLYCQDPRWWSAAQEVWSPIGLIADVPGGLLWNGGSGTSGDGLLWNGGLGTSGGGVEWQQSAGVSGGSVTVRNLGNDTAPVVFTMAGTGGTGLTNPYVRLESTGDTIQYNGVITPGNSVTVDTRTTKVQLGTTFVSGALLRSEMFELPPHSVNTITFASSGALDEGLLTGYHYHAYLGG